MYIYLFFIILGILLYILLNNYNTFSVGIPTYTIKSITPNTPFLPGPESDQIFTADADIPRENATNQRGQTLENYITAQIQEHGGQAFPGGPQNYVLVPNDSPEVDEGEPPEISEGETPCRVEERFSPSGECYRVELMSLGIEQSKIDDIIKEYNQNMRKPYMRYAFSCAAHTHLGSDSPLSFLSPDLFQLILSDSLLTSNIQYNPGFNHIYGIFSLSDLITILNYLKTKGMPLDFLIDHIINLLKLGLNVDEIKNAIDYHSVNLPYFDISEGDNPFFITIFLYLIVKDKNFYNEHKYDLNEDGDNGVALRDEFLRLVNGDPG